MCVLKENRCVHCASGAEQRCETTERPFVLCPPLFSFLTVAADGANNPCGHCLAGALGVDCCCGCFVQVVPGTLITVIVIVLFVCPVDRGVEKGNMEPSWSDTGCAAGALHNVCAR